MSATEQSAAAAGRPGLLVRLLTRACEVAGVEVLSPHFRMVSLSGEGLSGASWEAGHKLQMRMSGMSFRTFTPIAWDAVGGTTRFLAFRHADSPAGRWLDGLRPGMAAYAHGPRRSLDLSGAGPGFLFIGDETSVGPAVSVAGTGTQFLFEANDAGETRAVLTGLGIGDAEIIERMPGDVHYGALEAALAARLTGDAPQVFVLSGKAQTIQRMVKLLRARGIGSAQLRSKAYWAPGKTGLD